MNWVNLHRWFIEIMLPVPLCMILFRWEEEFLMRLKPAEHKIVLEVGHRTSERGTSGHGTSGHGTSEHGTSGHGTSEHGTSEHGTSGHGLSGHKTKDKILKTGR